MFHTMQGVHTEQTHTASYSSLQNFEFKQSQDQIMQKRICWHDPHVFNSENTAYIQKDMKTLTVNRYSEKEAATEFLKTSQSQWIVITSGSNGDQFLSGIHNLPAVGPVIVFCEHPEYHATWVDKYSKIKAITTSITEVLNNIASSSLLDSVGTNNPSGNVIPDENLCVVCMTNKKQYAFVPCGHLALCGTCKGNIPPVKCMICRADTTSITQIFM